MSTPTMLLLTQVVYVGLGVATFAHWLARRGGERLDIALMFASMAVATILGWFVDPTTQQPANLSIASGILIMAHPLLMLRIVWRFQARHVVIEALGWCTLGLSAVVLVAQGPILPPVWVAVLTLLFVAGEVYAAAALISAARRIQGVSRWRLGLAASGTALLGLIILAAGGVALWPEYLPYAEALFTPILPLSALVWYLGFLPPRALRRQWQLQELHHMLLDLDEVEVPVDRVLVRATRNALGASEVRFASADVDLPPPGRREAHDDPVFSGRGGFVYHARVAAHGQEFGHVLAWLPNGSLFPEADLALLDELAAAAARTLVHRTALDDQQRMVHELQALNRQLLEEGRHKDAFLANMSHELRTPMNSIIGFTEVLVDGKAGPVGPHQRELLDDVLVSSRHLLCLIEDLLDLSRIEAGRLRFEYQHVDLRELAETVVGAITAGGAPVPVDLVVEPVVRRVIADPTRVRQVLTNYLTNALKFTDSGRVEVSVTAAGWDHVRIAVSDTGIGIPPQDIPKLFRKFRQLDSGAGKRFQGTGLGLALTRSLVEGMGGTVGVDSQPGAGSTFWARIPRDPRPLRDEGRTVA